MKNKTRIRLLVALGALGSAHAENGTEPVKGMFAQTKHTAKVLLDVRARYEFGEQDGLDAAHAATLRARLGLESQDYNGFSGLIEFEATRAINTDTYFVPGIQGDPSRTTQRCDVAFDTFPRLTPVKHRECHGLIGLSCLACG